MGIRNTHACMAFLLTMQASANGAIPQRAKKKIMCFSSMRTNASKNSDKKSEYVIPYFVNSLYQWYGEISILMKEAVGMSLAMYVFQTERLSLGI